jgi:hypothetical protein
MIMRRKEKRQHRTNVWFAILCSVAFFGAVNYCNLEAFAAHPTQSHDAHQSASTEHPEEGSSAPTHHHDEDSVSCCAAMQALATSKSDFNLASSPAWQLHPVALQSSWLASFFEPSRTASGLSPPTREPPPARPFYRTTYANHAPPACLA